LLTYKLSHYSVMHKEDWHDLLSLCYRLSELFMMLIQFKHLNYSLCADEMSMNLEFKKETTEIS